MLNRFLSLFRKQRPMRSWQEFFFVTALEELHLPSDTIEIDHFHGRCWSAETDWVPVIFPEKVVSLTAALPREKSTDYFFRGFVSSNRHWVQEYPGCESSDYGRQQKTRYRIDESYYRSMAQARFGLAPVGDCPWSYRFFEAILCHALPVIGRDDHDLYAGDYHTLRDGDEHVYDASACESNYQTLIRRHTLRHLR